MINFGVRYYSELRSKHKEVFWRVEIAERAYGGSAEEMFFDGSNPLSITWEKRGDEFFAPVKASETTINILCRENFHYINLFTSDPRKYRVSIYRNTKLYWRGYVVTDLYSENFTAPPYQVSIKAVDGFNLLSSIPFFNADSSPISGRRNLLELLMMCVDVLELEIDVADWMDLYGEDMTEESSPLTQVYIDMERLYAVYAEPTYRDVLELCLRPFAGQIFQSNGTLHIRRAVSLYNNIRPVSFYSVGSEFPSGWLVTASSENIVTHIGEPIITSATRDRIESMWQEGLKVDGTTVMDIVPALRRVSVEVKNRMLQNLVSQLGIYDLSRWNDPHGYLTLMQEDTLRFRGDSAQNGHLVTHQGSHLHQCSYKTTFEFTLKSYYRRWSSTGGPYRPGGDYKVKVEYGFKVVGISATYYLQDDGQWINSETTIQDEVSISTEMNKKIEAVGIPTSGELVFFIKQTLIGEGTQHNGSEEVCEFKAMSITIDTGNDYEESLRYDMAVNRANNVDMTISLPIADIANIPNDQLIYSLYFIYANGKPTRMWRTRGGNDYNTLVNHLISGALRYKQLPARRISGEIFSGKHLDMNTVLQDDKYLGAGFYINSMELNCLDDTSNTELVEMPRLLGGVAPPEGDDCITVAELGFNVQKVLRCENQIMIHADNNKLYRYDTASDMLIEVCTLKPTAKIYPADSSTVVVDGETIRVIDYRGVTIHTLVSDNTNMATYMGGYLYTLGHWSDPRDPPRPSYYYMTRPEYKFSSDSYRRGYGEPTTYMYGETISLIKSFSTIAINTTQRAYLHDRRSNNDLRMYTMDAGSQVLSMSDYFFCVAYPEELKIYRRDSIGYEDRTLVKTIDGQITLADHTLAEVAYLQDDTVSIWTYRNNSTRTIKNLAGVTSAVKGLYYINGELYIIREKTLFKYIP